MNKIQVLGGGFPGTSKTWRFMRDMINEVQDLAVGLGGENCIVKGCEVVNGVAADGIVIINGESYPFQGGAVDANVEIVEAVEKVTYFTDADLDGQADLLDAYFDRYARFAAAGTGTPWADLKRITPLSEVARRLPPLKCALPYWGAVADIPDGWQLSDGTNQTPDMSGMFVVGYDPDDLSHDEIGKTGGESKHTLSVAEMPNHDHSGSVYIPAHKHGLPKTVYSKEGAGGDDNTFSNSNNTGAVNVTETSIAPAQSPTFTTAKKGGGTAHENRPKFYTMAWIAYVGKK
jgi:microcystin-dependent protein